MHEITFYLDFVSPYAWLAFEHLPGVLQGHSYAVRYQPVLLGALLRHNGLRGPAEVPAKRAWTYRHVQWLGHAQGTVLQMPAVHPFSPLPLLRLALACGQEDGSVNRHVARSIFGHVWEGGADALDPARLAALQARLAPARDPAGAEVKQRLRASTDEAAALGVFGTPTCVHAGRLFWGLDALPLLRASLDGDAWFDGPGWQGVDAIHDGLAGS